MEQSIEKSPFCDKGEENCFYFTFHSFSKLSFSWIPIANNWIHAVLYKLKMFLKNSCNTKKAIWGLNVAVADTAETVIGPIRLLVWAALCFELLIVNTSLRKLKKGSLICCLSVTTNNSQSHLHFANTAIAWQSSQNRSYLLVTPVTSIYITR